MHDEIEFCEQCQRYFDIRSGCEADIRADERKAWKAVFFTGLFAGALAGFIVAVMIMSSRCQ